MGLSNSAIRNSQSEILKGVYIGTSGYNYPHWWNGAFYPSDLPQKKWLEFYAEYYNTVELNVSFYRLPKKEVFQSWYRRTPKKFVFAVKGSRFITHIKRLKDCRERLRHTFEFRDESWFCNEAFRILEEFRFAFCIAHGSGLPFIEKITSTFTYLRLHGGEVLYGSDYSDKELKQWAGKIQDWRKKDKTVFVYFNNDAYGFAIKNGLQLKKIIS